MCGILALPSKTDFKPHTARFEFEGRSVWKEVESENVLVLFCFCSLGHAFDRMTQNDPVMTQKLPSFEISKLSCKMPGLLDQKLGHLLGDEKHQNDPVKSDGIVRVSKDSGRSG